PFSQLLHPLRLAHTHPAVLRLPAVKRLLADAMLAAQLRRPETCFGLLQHPYDLLFGKSALLQLRSPRLARAGQFSRRTLNHAGSISGEHISGSSRKAVPMRTLPSSEDFARSEILSG